MNKEKGWWDQADWIGKRDSLGGFHLRIAAFDAGCANAAAGQDINREKGWCAVRTLHIVFSRLIATPHKEKGW